MNKQLLLSLLAGAGFVGLAQAIEKASVATETVPLQKGSFAPIKLSKEENDALLAKQKEQRQARLGETVETVAPVKGKATKTTTTKKAAAPQKKRMLKAAPEAKNGDVAKRLDDIEIKLGDIKDELKQIREEHKRLEQQETAKQEVKKTNTK